MKLIIILFLISCSSELKALSETFLKFIPGHIECIEDKVIFVKDVQMLNLNENLSNMCSKTLTTKVREICDGQSVCQIVPSIESPIEECDSWTELIVTYQCKSQNETSSLSSYQQNNELTKPNRFKRSGRNNNRNRPTCPHNVFERKHVCRNCRFNNLNDVVNFAIRVQGIREDNEWADTNLNSVFTGSPSYTQRGTRCVFTRPVRKYNCHRAQGTWNCFFDNNRYATHDLNSGHYDHRQDV